jgi:hypothetical protein
MESAAEASAAMPGMRGDQLAPLAETPQRRDGEGQQQKADRQVSV